jgi:DNA processing protein
MNEIKTIYPEEFPPLLKQINDPPKQLHIQGNLDPLFDETFKILCVVGTRRYSHYGKEVVHKLISGLRGYNICIVSGLAYGIDSIAHRAALDAGLPTVAFPGSGLDPSVLYPQAHKKLAREIVEKGGALVSEFDMLQHSDKWTFPSRNRLMAGVSHGVLTIECSMKSGTMITTKNAAHYNRDVAAVPGSIFSPLSAGPHYLIGEGAMAVTCTDDLLEFLGFARRNGQTRLPLGENPQFQLLPEADKILVRYLEKGPRSKDQLVEELGIDPQTLNRMLSALELDGFIKEEGGVMRVV